MTQDDRIIKEGQVQQVLIQKQKGKKIVRQSRLGMTGALLKSRCVLPKIDFIHSRKSKETNERVWYTDKIIWRFWS